MSIESDKLEKSLNTKGFLPEPGDHRYFRLHVNGKATSIRTKVSHGRKYTLGDDLVTVTKRQMGGLTKRELTDFVSCELSEEKYVQLLVERGAIRVDDDSE